ncbi:MAG: UPF0158 family protein [Woeseiaceae bacterium]
MPIVSRTELELALQWVSSDFFDNEAYICLRTGKIYWIGGDPGAVDEQEEVPEDIDNSDKYLPVPDKRELDLGKQLVFDFARQFLPQSYDDVRDMFRRKGAYRRFKNFLERRELLEEWYRYSEEQEAKALAEWCEAEGLELGP